MTIRLLIIFFFLPVVAHAEFSHRGDAFIGSSLDNARSQYRLKSQLPRIDCDPVGDGRWICASYRDPVIDDFLTGEPGRLSGLPVAVAGDDLQQARRTFKAATILARRDCDPAGQLWICASFQNPTMAHLVAVPSAMNERATTTASVAIDGENARSVNPITSVEPERESVSQSQRIPAGARLQMGDLIALNYDSCPDPDDLHAAVAGKMILDHYGLQQGSNYIVVNGTCGDLRPRSNYIENSAVLFDQLYGKAWFDAFRHEAASISAVAELYQQRLEAGYQVWVLDGGPMDFTARVIRHLRSVGTAEDLQNIRVVQHSHGWNQANTDAQNLAYMTRHADYIKIANGNYGNNATAQLNQSNVRSTVPDVDQALVGRFLADTRHGDNWQVAFSLFDTDKRFDGSDTVELLWLMGQSSREIADWYDFADYYIHEGSANEATSGSQDTVPDNSQSSEDVVVTPTPVTVNASVHRLEAEAVPLTDGWVLETARTGYQGSGYIRWAAGNQYAAGGNGVLSYSFVPSVSGVYQVKVRARAINPPTPDLNNDVWMRMDGEQVLGSADFSDWVKVFTTGGDSWQLGGSVDMADAHQNFRQQLFAGDVYKIELSGRSGNYAIDYLEVKRDNN